MRENEELRPTPSEPNWKFEIRERFEAWLSSLPDHAESALWEPESPESASPDLYSFYEELCALRSEVQRGSRKNTEAFSRFSESIASLSELSHALQAMEDEPGLNPKELKKHLIALVDLRTRILRIERTLQAPLPVRKGIFGWLSNDSAWRAAWKSLHGGFEILRIHFDGLLKQFGVTRIAAMGKPFDPSLMVALAIEETTEGPLSESTSHVKEEITPGYLWNDEVLRASEVSVTRQAGHRGNEKQGVC